MRQRAFTIATMIAGSYFVYCAESATGGAGSPGANGTRAEGTEGSERGGMVPSAQAQTGGTATCCTATPPAFKKLAEGTVSLAAAGRRAVSPAVDVSAYRRLSVLTLFAPGATGCGKNNVGFHVEAQFQASDSDFFAGDVDANYLQGNKLLDNGTSELSVAAPILRLGFAAPESGAECRVRYAIVGIE